MNRLACLLFVSLGVAVTCAAVDGAVTIERCDHGATVKIDGQPFCDYWTKSGNKPIVWPILGPTGKPMTRSYPMAKGVNEKEDHIHHRSLWFTHGEINGVNFWDEGRGTEPRGVEEHREFVKIASGPEGTIITRDDWMSPEGKKVCEDQRTLLFGSQGDQRYIDFTIMIKASDGPVRFGETKEGSFGLRVAETMKVDAKLGGRIVNSEGQVDKDAWGQRAAWVDYQGPVDGQKLGIAVLNHPSSFRYPTHWHVRTYGLYAANPFGEAAFAGKKTTSEDVSYELPKGQSVTLRYKVILHEGDEREAKIADAFAAYAKQAK